MLLTSDIQILRVTRIDVPTLSKIHYQVNISQPPNRFLWTSWPNEAAQLAANEAEFHEILDEEGKDGKELWKIVVDGVIVGGLALRWSDSGKEKGKEGKTEDHVTEGINSEFRKCMISMLVTATTPFRGKNHLSKSNHFTFPFLSAETDLTLSSAFINLHRPF